jgi:hypothetical protein
MTKEVKDQMDSTELDKKLRLPDPAKTLEVVWKLLGRTRLQLNNTTGNSGGTSAYGEARAAQKLAKLEAERQKARGTQYGLRTTVR